MNLGDDVSHTHRCAGDVPTHHFPRDFSHTHYTGIAGFMPIRSLRSVGISQPSLESALIFSNLLSGDPDHGLEIPQLVSIEA